MDDVYPIEVLHVVNPHIIFVEARDESNRLVFEQVGIYGVVPVNQTLDIDGRLVSERSENWALVATSAINELLAGNVQAYFMLVQHETRSTIFDNNSVKFGHILIKTDKQIVSIKDHLEKLSVVENNEALFQQRLSSGSLKLKLNYVRTEEVLKAIRNYYVKHNRDEDEWETTLNRQTTLFQETKKISNKLTAENLELLQRNDNQNCNVLAVIERKTRDLDLCKDADLSSLGCGSRRKKGSSKVDENSASSALKNMKRFLDANSRVHHENYSPNSDIKYQNDIENVSAHDDFWDKPYQTESKINKVLKYNNYVEKKSDSNATDKSMDEFVKKKYCRNKNDVVDALSPNISSGGGSANQYTPKYVEPPKSEHQDNNINDASTEPMPTRNIERKGNIHQMMPKSTPERLVAYGPPCKADLVNLKIHKLSYNAPSPYATKTEEKLMSDEKCEENVETAWNEDEIDFGDITINQKHLNLNKQPKEVIKENKIAHESSVETNTQKIRNTSDNSSNSETTKDKRLLKLLKYTKMQKDLSCNSDTSLKTPKVQKESASSNSDTSVNTPKDDEDIEIIKEKLNSQYKPLKFEIKTVKPIENIPKVERNVNPFNNLDGSKSVFVDKLVKPILMVHTKNDNLILPQQNIRDVPFKTSIHVMLRNMNVKEPFRMQTVSWTYIMRGHSVFMVGHAGGGKSLGYIPAVCNIVLDSTNLGRSLGPICVIVCATAASVTWIEEHCKRFLGLDESVLSCYSGVDLTEFIPSLLNGCDVLVITAPMLYRLLGTDFGVDLRRLTTLVFEDGERLSEVYASEIKVILHHVKDMLKNRADHSWKVQYVVASRQWCDFMTPLAKSAPDTVIAIAAFQECVPYSKTPTSVQFVLKANKINAVLEFLNEIDSSKRTVIVCRSDDEVAALEVALKGSKRAVFSCNNAMTVHDLYNLNVLWDKYEEPVLGPILICCDGNLTHMNITNAHYLVHFSMPELFTMFCKRFAVLNENYASIFEPQNEKVKVKILLEDTNSEQLPKILHFLKRCTNESFPMLTEITQRVLEEKDKARADRLVPICNTLMTLGECGDLWYCVERHAILKDYDEPKPWMPKEGLINFKITSYNSAVTYSARLLSNVTKAGTTKYPNNFNTLLMKMGMYYSKEPNRKLQGVIKLGDVCAIAVKPNFFERCQVVKILSYNKGNPHAVLVNLIDEEKFETTRDVHLYHLPEEFRAIETHVVKVRLANVRPQDKDVTFSSLARNELKKITDNDENLYLRGEVIMTVGNCIFVDSLEACQNLPSLGETVVKYDFKKQLLSRHAEPNPDHIPKLQALGGIVAKTESKVEVTTPPKTNKAPKWAHLDKDDFSTVIFAAAENAGEFFLRLEKFHKVIDSLVKDIQKVVESLEELPRSKIYVGSVVLAEFPDDATYERARIDAIIDENKVKCFFVDNGDWREVSIKKLKPIPDNILHRVPFQAIECRLVGVKPPSDDWTDFGNNWFCDNCFEDSNGKTKYLFAKYFTKEEAKITGGRKYGVILVDTSGDSDIVINKQMIELNLARENDLEVDFLNQPLDIKVSRVTDDSDEEFQLPDTKDLFPVQNVDTQKDDKTVKQLLFEKPIRTVPLYNSDDDDSEFDFNFDRDELAEVFKATPGKPTKIVEIDKDSKVANVRAITNGVESGSDVSKDTNTTKTIEPTDSDDCAEKSKNEIATLRRILSNKKERSENDKELDSDDISSVSSLQNDVKVDTPKIIDVTDPPRKPKLVWRQNKNAVTVKIQLIGAEQYNLDIKERSMKFHAYHNDTNYEFEFELYGLVDVKKCRHSSKGQYILVVLPKIMKRNWLNLARDCTVKNWMVYDVDALESSSDEEKLTNDDQIEVLKRNFEQNDTESEDEFADDANFSYKRDI